MDTSIEGIAPEPRRCKLCGKVLSKYNFASICWSHQEHPDYGGQIELRQSYREFCCDGRTCGGFLRALMDYYGELRDW